MKLALLGCDDETLALVRTAIAESDHALVAAYDTAEFMPQVQALAPIARLDEDWETLLLGNLADVVIVARTFAEVSRNKARTIAEPTMPRAPATNIFSIALMRASVGHPYPTRNNRRPDSLRVCRVRPSRHRVDLPRPFHAPSVQAMRKEQNTHDLA